MSRSPGALLALVLAGVLALLLARGLDLGFTGDLLDYAYHYEQRGVFGGMNWLVVDHWQRHLFAGVFSAPLAYLFPRASAPWYAFAFAAHFAAAVACAVLADAILRGRQRWVAFAAGLMFAFHALHARLNFEFPTSGHGNSALALALLSLWLYLRFVRRGRRERLWLELALATFIIALGTYEQTALFFLLHPVIAWFEDRRNGLPLGVSAFTRRVARDSLWFPAAVGGYLFLLRVLFPGSGNLVLEPAHVIAQLERGLAAEFAPGLFVGRVAPAVTGAPVLTLAVATGIAALLWWWMNAALRPSPSPLNRDAQPAANEAGFASTGGRDDLVYLTILGVGVIVVSIAGVAPVKWSILDHPRLIYPSAVGFAYLVAGLLALVGLRAAAGRLIFVLAVAALAGTGVTRLLQTQAEFAAQTAARERVLAAIHDVIPAVSDDPLPYLLIYSDAHPSTDLWLYAQDSRFPYIFDRMYGVSGMAADAIYLDLDETLAPPPDLPGSRYNGQFIIAEPEGIYSPLKPYTPIDPATLVIVYFDDRAGTAAVVEALPPDVLAAANIIERAPVEWRTNHSLIRTGGGA